MKPFFTARRTFLFLQGPPGAFFARLGAELAVRGHRVHRINFHGGDRRNWPGPATDFRGRAETWPSFFDNFTRDHGVTDLVLFGDCRPMHRIAHGIAKLAGLRTHVFEEGYIRPDWVTLELDGVNGHSTLSRDPRWFLEAARNLPPVPALPPVPSSFDRRAREALTYYTAFVLGKPRFPHYRSHRPGSVTLEGLSWLVRLAKRKRGRARAEALFAAIRDSSYFVFPLQLNSDHQIRVHSPFGDMKVAIAYVIENFARAAPPDTNLIVKQHPLDNGLFNWRRLVSRQAAARGVADRVIFLEDGDIDAMVKGAEGVVTVNSTTGTLALGAGIPVAVLGQAVYHIPGITHQGALDSFWRAPERPDPLIYDAFYRVLVDRCLVRGGFTSDEALTLLVQGSVRRLTEGFDGRVSIAPEPERR